MPGDILKADVKRLMAILGAWSWGPAGRCSCCGNRSDMLDATGACVRSIRP